MYYPDKNNFELKKNKFQCFQIFAHFIDIDTKIPSVATKLLQFLPNFTGEGETIADFFMSVTYGRL